jgi:hypothetical protein
VLGCGRREGRWKGADEVAGLGAWAVGCGLWAVGSLACAKCAVMAVEGDAGHGLL